MFAKLPMYQNIGASAYKEDISNIISICDHLDNPQNKFKSIHVGGTNGKGSTSHMLSSILQESGYKVGLYTSPHLVDFRERIKINGEMISKESVEYFMNQNLNFFDRNNFSFFEMTVGLAFNYFNNQSYVGISESLNTEGISSLDSSRLNNALIGGALFRNTSTSNYTHTWTVPAGVTSVSVVCIGSAFVNPAVLATPNRSVAELIPVTKTSLTPVQSAPLDVW